MWVAGAKRSGPRGVASLGLGAREPPSAQFRLSPGFLFEVVFGEV
jgi:hypothetical protein